MRILIAGVLLLGAAACAPVYTTQYVYRLPVIQNSVCISECEAGRSLCRGKAEMHADDQRVQCEMQTSGEYEHCLNRSINGADPALCLHQSCYTPVESGACDEGFRDCFKTCGGVVEARQVCSQNCP